MGCGERKQDPSHSHLVYFQRSAFPSAFPSLDLSALGSERGQVAPRAFSLYLLVLFPPSPFASFCTLKSLQLPAQWQAWGPASQGSPCLLGKPCSP